MIRHEVSILEPGITDNGRSEAWKAGYAADVYIKPPVTIGAELGKFIGGVAGRVSISEVVSTDEGSHVTVACAEGRAAYEHGDLAVEQAIGRLRTYLDTEPSQLGMLRKTFAEQPLLGSHSPRQT